MTQREIAVLKLRELGMYPMGVPDEIVESYIAVHKAIESKRTCGKCDRINKKLHLDWKSPDNKYCKSLEMFTAKDFFCADFEPKKENSDE